MHVGLFTYLTPWEKSHAVYRRGHVSCIDRATSTLFKRQYSADLLLNQRLV